MAYAITLDKDDVGAIDSLCYQYNWARCMVTHGLDTVGVHEIPEWVAWEMMESWVENGLEFSIPCLNENSNLMGEFIRLNSEIV